MPSDKTASPTIFHLCGVIRLASERMSSNAIPTATKATAPRDAPSATATSEATTPAMISLLRSPASSSARSGKVTKCSISPSRFWWAMVPVA